MTETEIILSVLAVIFFVVASVLFYFFRKNQKQVSKLSESIDSFLQGGKKLNISTEDNTLATLQNSICDLEDKLVLEKENTRTQAKKHASFIADVSHQLKTPLAGLKLYCEMDKAQNTSSYSEKELQLIEKMENLIKSLLRLEKLRSDTYTMNFSEQRAENILGELKGEFEHLFPEKEFVFSGNAVFRCDKQWLSEALGNIIKNAGEHTPAGGKVSVTAEDGDKSVLFTIQDNGTGIDEKDLPKLFDRFYKAGNSSADSAGIGMSIAKAVVEKHHGTIFAENTGEGLRVVICLPKFDGEIKI